jgi:hypothetical protein
VVEFMQDVDGSTFDLLRSANMNLVHLDQKALTIWDNCCMEQGRQVMHLASKAYMLLTTDNWSLNDCDEFLDELEEEEKKTKKSLQVAPNRQAQSRDEVRVGQSPERSKC